MKAFLAVFFFSSLSFATIEVGTWTGTAADGSACQMVAGDQYFVNDLRHPLNERVPVTVNGVEFVVGHPPMVDAATATAFFNHDLFQGVVATTTGAHAVVVEMAHTETAEGPQNFTFITHNYKTGERKSLVCSGIKHTR